MFWKCRTCEILLLDIYSIMCRVYHVHYVPQERNDFNHFAVHLTKMKVCRWEIRLARTGTSFELWNSPTVT